MYAYLKCTSTLSINYYNMVEFFIYTIYFHFCRNIFPAVETVALYLTKFIHPMFTVLRKWLSFI